VRVRAQGGGELFVEGPWHGKLGGLGDEVGVGRWEEVVEYVVF
jgi:hypothetical protein